MRLNLAPAAPDTSAIAPYPSRFDRVLVRGASRWLCTEAHGGARREARWTRRVCDENTLCNRQLKRSTDGPHRESPPNRSGVDRHRFRHVTVRGHISTHAARVHCREELHLDASKQQPATLEQRDCAIETLQLHSDFELVQLKVGGPERVENEQDEEAAPADVNRDALKDLWSGRGGIMLHWRWRHRGKKTVEDALVLPRGASSSPGAPARPSKH